MDILSRHFHTEVLKPDGRKSEVSFTGEDALAAIAYAEVLAPQIERLCDGLEQRDLSKGSFDERLIDLVVAQAALNLSQEVTTDDGLLSPVESWRCLRSRNHGTG